jgi:glutamine cyclotransferase
MVAARDLPCLRRFYEDGLGWTLPAARSIIYKVGNSILMFLDAAYLAQESGVVAVPHRKA